MSDRVEIGDAVLYHGDCMEILPTLGRVDAMVTDPPYGIKASSNWKGKHGKSEIHGDQDTEVRDAALAYCDAFICFGSWRMPRPNRTKAILIWDKTERAGMGDLSFPWKPNYEEIYVTGDGFSLPKRRSSILRFAPYLPCVGKTMETDHPYQKPVELMEHLVSASSGTVLDPFTGSGTTGVACANLGRKFIGIEIERKYFDIACERIDAAYAQGQLFE